MYESKVFSIADLNFLFLTDSRNILEKINYLLRNHVQISSGCIIEIEIRVKDDMSLETYFTEIGETNKKKFKFCIPRNSEQWLTESFYYKSLTPILNNILGCNEVLRLHAALLYHSATGSILLFGDRGAGKTTTTSSWLNSGGNIATDDVTLVRKTNGNYRVFGLYRDLHIDPILISKLNQLNGLSESKEYLPGYNRLSYDWLLHFDERRITRTQRIRHVIFSSVNKKSLTKINKINIEEGLYMIINNNHLKEDNEKMSDETMGEMIERLLSHASFWEVSWGEDIWSYPKQHLGFLSTNLK